MSKVKALTPLTVGANQRREEGEIFEAGDETQALVSRGLVELVKADKPAPAKVTKKKVTKKASRKGKA